MKNTIRFRACCAALGIAACVAAPAASATVHRVFPNQSIQAAIDAAAPGDTILVEPGTYLGTDPKYGLRIAKNNLRLIGKTDNGKGKPGKVRVLYAAGSQQETGVYAAPVGCDYDVKADSALGQDCNSRKLKGFYIRGFTVEGFPVNGIQTRWVDGFEFVANESVRNLNNGIYPTLSANGLVRDNVSYGSLDTAMWVAASENVRVINNVMYGSVIGFEITVSNNVWVTHNKIYDNTLGIGLFHPNGAGNPPLPVMANWVDRTQRRAQQQPAECGRARDLPERVAAGHRDPGRGRFRSRGREKHRRRQQLRRHRRPRLVHGQRGHAQRLPRQAADR